MTSEAQGSALLLGLWNEHRMWRAVGVFRLCALVYAAGVYLATSDDVRRPALGWVLLGVMALWTALLLVKIPPPDALVVADLVVAVLLLWSTWLVDRPERILDGAQTLPTMWVAASVLGWAVWHGRRTGLIAAAVISLNDLLEIRWQPSVQTVYNIVLLVLAGTIVGYAVEVFRAGRQELARAVSLEAATQERERLASGIHDSVLQVLAFVQRRAFEIGGETTELGRLAGEQEIRLRALVSSGGVSSPGNGALDGRRDILGELGSLAAGRVTVTGPAEPVLLDAPRAVAVVEAVAAALDNVDKHAGARAQAWVLVEDEGDTVAITVRDDGVGIPPGRLERAVAEGRLGVAASIRARITAVGGAVEVTCTPGEGTEVELRVPKSVSSS